MKTVKSYWTSYQAKTKKATSPSAPAYFAAPSAALAVVAAAATDGPATDLYQDDDMQVMAFVRKNVSWAIFSSTWTYSRIFQSLLQKLHYAQKHWCRRRGCRGYQCTPKTFHVVKIRAKSLKIVAKSVQKWCLKCFGLRKSAHHEMKCSRFFGVFSFSGKLGEIWTKILRTPKNSPSPTPMLKRYTLPVGCFAMWGNFQLLLIVLKQSELEEISRRKLSGFEVQQPPDDGDEYSMLAFAKKYFRKSDQASKMIMYSKVEYYQKFNTEPKDWLTD